MKMHDHALRVIGHLAMARNRLDKAERAQSEMDPIEGPGSAEWEIIRRRIEAIEADLCLAIDHPGELEARPALVDTWDEGGEFLGIDQLIVRPQNSGLWTTFEVAGFEPVTVAVALKFDNDGGEFLEVEVDGVRQADHYIDNEE